MEINNNEVKSKKILFMIIIGVVLVSLIFLSSYAFFSYIRESNDNVVSAGKIHLNFEENGDNILLINRFPMPDSEAYNMIANEGEVTNIEFNVTGYYTGGGTLGYKVSAVKGETVTDMNRFPDEHVKLFLTGKTNDFGSFTIQNGFDTEDGTNGKYGALASNGNSGVDTNNGGEIILATGQVAEEESIHTYNMKMWIDNNIKISDTESTYTYCASERECIDDRLVYSKMYYTLKLKVENIK